MQGYRRGATDTLARLDDELAKQARAAFAASALAEEAAKAAFVEGELQRVASEARKRCVAADSRPERARHCSGCVLRGTTLAPPKHSALHRRSPRRPLECQDEERAVVACNVQADGCAAAIAAYAACADALLVRHATPALGPLA